MRRRDFLNLLGMTSLVALAGCTLPPRAIENIGKECKKQIADDSILRIDMHCHLKNIDDANSTAFVKRRFLENVPFLGFTLDTAASLVLPIVRVATKLTTQSSKTEAKYLQKELSYGKAFNPHEFCEEVSKRQRGSFLSDDFKEGKPIRIGKGRTMGFTSNRLRNAALMMAQWEQVDIFMPSIVDFYEGIGGGSAEEPEDLARFYSKLNLVTRGRFLPLISYHPRRQIDALKKRAKGEEVKTPLELVEDAITKYGFIGVKVHPSSGFNPIENAKYGCRNGGPFVKDRKLGEEDGAKYDKAMTDLYELCDRLDFPILTHGSDSLAAESDCMHEPESKPQEWTGSAHHWINAVNEESAKKRDVKVCLGHFASRFQNHEKGLRGEYGSNEFHVEYKDDRALEPSAWLAAAEGDIKQNDNSNIWLDLSYMVELIYSAAKDDKVTRRWPHIFRSEGREDPDGKFACAFKRFLAERPHLLEKTMYGTDWHMPEVSRIGDLYQDLMENLLPKEAKERVMGLNAVEFFGLYEGRANRERLNEFYKDNGIDEEIPWMKRVDARWKKKKELRSKPSPEDLSCDKISDVEYSKRS